MIEAALIFPIVILTAVSMLYLMTGLYGEADALSHNSAELRAMAGGETIGSDSWHTELVGSSVIKNNTDMLHKKGILNEHLTAKTGHEYEAKGLWNLSANKSYEQSERIINEAVFIRCVDIGKWALQASS